MLRILLFLLCVTSSFAQLPSGFVQTQVGRNLNPTTLTVAPGGRLFVVGKEGKIYEIINDVVAPDPFMTIGGVDTYNERGLSGLCFHPDFPKTPYFYVYYSVKGADHNRLSRFQMLDGVADPASEKILFDFDPLLGTIHNAGVLRFGPDRKLYVSLGDGSNGTMAQSLTSFLGKVLRMNDDGSVPANNPFVGKTTGSYQTIYALGFRNPFSMDIDPLSGQILVGDVGSDLFEEVNNVQAGYNYGWPGIEGKRTNQTAPANYADPIYSYRHGVDCAVAGLTFYDPPTVRFPDAYKGKAFVSDYCGGTIHTLDPATGQITGDLVTGIDRPIAMVTSPDGYLYYVARGGMGGGSQQDNTATGNGSVYKVSYSDSGKPYIKTQTAGAFVPVGESVTLSVEALGQKPLTYRWYRDGKLLAGAVQEKYTISSPALADNGALFLCIVSNAQGADTTKAMALKVVQGQRPMVRILYPLPNSTYQGGGTIAYAGEALNANQQLLTNAKLTWWIDFHHEDHVHPALDPITGPASGIYKVPRVGETSTQVWYRVHFMATDVSGLTAETFVDVKPQLTVVTVKSKPAVAQLTVDGHPYSTELTFSAVAGTIRTLSVKPYLSTPSGFYKFSNWSNGQSSTSIAYEVPAADGSITINYTALPSPGGNGLLGEYYSNRSDFTGQPALTRVDTTVDYYWAYDSPDIKVSKDNFLIRWSGKIQAPFTDTFTFSPETDDGVRLWVNNRLIIDKWVPQPATEWNAEIDLQAGQTYTIRMEYFEEQAEATARLRWSSPQFDKAIICKPQLFAGQITLVTAIDPAIDASLTIFPQPAHDQLTVRYVAARSGPVQIDITDLMGRRIFQQTSHALAGTNEYDIRLASWPAGLYHMAVRPAGQEAVFRRMLVR